MRLNPVSKLLSERVHSYGTSKHSKHILINLRLETRRYPLRSALDVLGHIARNILGGQSGVRKINRAVQTNDACDTKSQAIGLSN